MQLPASTTLFADALPHRGRAVWIDEVSSLRDQGGQCAVSYNPAAAYATNDGVTETCYVEWIAQSYGFICAARSSAGAAERAQVAFLAAIKRLVVYKHPTALAPGDQIVVDVEATHRLGPLTLLEGKVFLRGELLANAQLKVFAQ